MSGIDQNGHLFAEIRGDAIGFCVGCGHTEASPEAARRCADAVGLADDMEAQDILDRLRLTAV
ncbi:hypothetical protein R6V09_12365 [Streptomyces sp. W16]|uniref:hypothetical protein n=1 Tax=Streptomyces sp. W16 TaxID=3076631 RepID=UPI00295A812B|nr:hypothetical protein [Streptomyces sp. W16]MDV9170925.1 hypothetical protein [Streptomyces sp. W16]